MPLQLVYLNYLPISAPFIYGQLGSTLLCSVCKDSSMTCTTYFHFFFKHLEHLAAWERSKFESVFLLQILLHCWFFINLQMSTEWEFAFLNTGIIIFYLMYSLIIFNCNQNLSFFPVEGCQSLQNWHFGTVVIGELVTWKQSWNFFLCCFTDFCLVLMAHRK